MCKEETATIPLTKAGSKEAEDSRTEVLLTDVVPLATTYSSTVKNALDMPFKPPLQKHCFQSPCRSERDVLLLASSFNSASSCSGLSSALACSSLPFRISKSNSTLFTIGPAKCSLPTQDSNSCSSFGHHSVFRSFETITRPKRGMSSTIGEAVPGGMK